MLVPWTPRGHWTPALHRSCSEQGDGAWRWPRPFHHRLRLWAKAHNCSSFQGPPHLPTDVWILSQSQGIRDVVGAFFFFLFCFFWREAILDFKFSIPFGLHNDSFTDPAKAAVLHRDDFAPERHVATSRGICVLTAGKAGEASGTQRAEARDAPRSPAPQQKIVRLRCPQGQGGNPWSQGVWSSPLRIRADYGLLIQGRLTAISHRDTETKITATSFHGR